MPTLGGLVVGLLVRYFQDGARPHGVADVMEAGVLHGGRLSLKEGAVAALGERVSDTFEQACELLLACKGRVIVTGMGKSGHIGSKLAATLASTGTPSFFVHPGEASHGDLGMITTEDAVLASDIPRSKWHGPVPHSTL